MSVSRRAFAAAALLAVVCVASTAPLAAQAPPPDVRGSYLVSGTLSLFDCNADGGEFVVPFSAFFTVTEQEGNAISGSLGFPEQQQYILFFTGHVSPDGLMEGTFEYAQDTGGVQVLDPTWRGEVRNGKVSAQFDATFAAEGASCRYRIAVASESATLSWSPPDPNAAGLAPPRALTIVPNPASPLAKAARDGEPTGYNVYTSSTPGVAPVPENLLTSVPPGQTSVPAPVNASGSFFVVTATYPEGESEPSNEVSGGVPAGTIADVKASAKKLRITGEGFSSTVTVFVDGIPFVARAKVKGGGRTVIQKGALLTGQSLAQYLTPGRTVAITVRNENGGVATYLYTKP